MQWTWFIAVTWAVTPAQKGQATLTPGKTALAAGGNAAALAAGKNATEPPLSTADKVLNLTGVNATQMFTVEGQVAERLSKLSQASNSIQDDAKQLEEMSGAKYTKGLGASSAEVVDPLTVDLAVMKADLNQLPKETINSGNSTRIMEEMVKLSGLARKLQGLETTPPILYFPAVNTLDNVGSMELMAILSCSPRRTVDIPEEEPQEETSEGSSEEVV
ncbi:MAG: uncharacterized protein KVP18_003547 [Porospora cf. gigantea A]|uniref:uncharacterized protein n=1 Tax=Porospora cf. gigantea A TaxID=2853593 RepID=UPI00355ABBC8|nr:MAG: hypothetical protein KVP18_003547 [Porospora cf. gigantea A]